MADAPRLSSATDASAAKYAPLSGAAVAAVATAGLFVVALLILGWMAYSSGQPLLNLFLLLIPAAGIVLAYLGRRHVLTSEGARTGIGFANAAWWVCVIGGACYVAYWVATEMAVRAEAERELVRWADKVKAGNPTDPADQEVQRAFYFTVEAGGGSQKNPAVAHSPTFALGFALFRNSPLVQLTARNRGAVQIQPSGLRNWAIAPDSGNLACEVSAVLKCPEGEFPLVVPLTGSRDKAKTGPRTWLVQPMPGFKYLDPDQGSRTRYGWLIAVLDANAQMLAGQLVGLLREFPPPVPQRAVVDGFLSGRTDPDRAKGTLNAVAGGLPLVGGPAVLVSDPGDAFFARTSGQPLTDAKFTRPDGGETEKGSLMLRGVWEQPLATGLNLAGGSGFTQPEVAARNTVIEITDTRVLLKVPVVFQPRTDDYLRTKGTFTTGYLVVVLDDAVVLKELNDARAAGGALSKTPPADLTSRQFPLRLVRLESDLVPMAAPQQAQAGGPPGG